MIGDVREGHPQDEVQCVQWWNSGVSQQSSLKARHTNSSVVGCKNQNQCLYYVPATEKLEETVVAFHFYDNMPAAVCVSLYVCANHFTSDCFSNEGQYKAGFASTLTLVKGSVPTVRDPATAPEPPISVAAVWLYLQLLTSTVKSAGNWLTS